MVRWVKGGCSSLGLRQPTRGPVFNSSDLLTLTMISKLGLPISPRSVCSDFSQYSLLTDPLPPSHRTSGHIVVGVCITVIIFNLLEALQLAYLWNALKWEPETEWDEWRMNGVRVVVGLVCGYLLWTCCAAFVGLLGALKVCCVVPFIFIPFFERLWLFLHRSTILPICVSSGIAPLSIWSFPSFSQSLPLFAHPDNPLEPSCANSYPANQNYCGVSPTLV